MNEQALPGPDLSLGLDATQLLDGKLLLGHAFGEAVLLARRGEAIFAVGATCTHYGGPLAEGLMVGGTVRCPWHHACFDLRSGEARRPPAFDPVARWDVELRDGRVFVTGKAKGAPATPQAPPRRLASIVIVGGGAAGLTAAETLRREGHTGKITLLSADAEPPCDRPNLSKDYLAGEAPEEWIPLRPAEYYADRGVDLVLRTRARAVNVANKTLLADTVTETGERTERTYAYDALLLATGADPVKLSTPGADLPHVHVLRTLADSRSIIAAAGRAKRAVVIGASFIGLEVAAALRTRKLEVHVVAPDARPLERILGKEVGDFVRGLHERHGVVFHLGQTASRIDAAHVTLANGETLAADLVVTGVGVRPALALAENAGLALDRGIAVNEYLETSVPGIFAAGDIARWPDVHTGQKIRVEHWVVAERQGQIAARNILGMNERCDFVPFFWSQHYDVRIAYVGHAEQWDDLAIDGSVDAGDCRLTYRKGDRTLAVVTIGRDRRSLEAELEMEQGALPR